MSTVAPADIVGRIRPEPGADAPAKHDLFGVNVSAAGPETVVNKIIAWASERRAKTVDFMAVHSLIVAARDPEHRARMNKFDIVACDGQPMRWAMNFFHKTKMPERVYGPDTTLKVCQECAKAGIGVYLYGGRPETLEPLADNLLSKAPGLKIVGAESPPFRPLTQEEDDAAVRRIEASGAGVLFIGIGCPKQEIFAADHKDRINAVQLCVGAAFDFHAGTVKQAPPWMQKRGLEWLYRLCREPRRLWKRYLVTNSIFVAYFLRRLILPPRSAQ